MTNSASNHTGAIPISSGRMVRFAANIPVEIALQCLDGTRIEGRATAIASNTRLPTIAHVCGSVRRGTYPRTRDTAGRTFPGL